MDNTISNTNSNNNCPINMNPLARQLTSDLTVNYDDTTTSELTYDYNNLTNGSYGDYIEPIINPNSLQFNDERNQLDCCIKETAYPFNLIETVNYHQQPNSTSSSSSSSSPTLTTTSTSPDYRPTLEPTTTINADYVNTYNLLTNQTPTLWSQSTSYSTINTNQSSPGSSSVIRPRSNSFSSINLNHHHHNVNHSNQYNPSTILTQPPRLIEPTSIVFNESPLTTMVTTDYDNNQINQSPINVLTLQSTESISKQQTTQTSTPSMGYYCYRPFTNVSFTSSSCFTSTSSLYPPSPISIPLSSSSSSSLVDRGDYLFTIDDGDLSSGSSIASSTSSSSSSSRLPRKRSVNDDDHFYHHLSRKSYHHRSIKLTKKEKLDKMMSEDKRLETENEMLREQIRVMEHQFKVLQSKITNILIDAAKKAS